MRLCCVVPLPGRPSWPSRRFWTAPERRGTEFRKRDGERAGEGDAGNRGDMDRDMMTRDGKGDGKRPLDEAVEAPASQEQARRPDAAGGGVVGLP